MAQHDVEEDCMEDEGEYEDVEVNIEASGDLDEIVREYFDYMRRRMPYIAALTPEVRSRLVRIVIDADDAEVNKYWRVSIDDVQSWNLYGDAIPRAIVFARAKGDAYRLLCKAIKEALGKDIDEDQEADIKLYALLCAQYEEDGKFNFNKVFDLESQGHVRLIIDSCCFDPSKLGGDTLYIDVEKSASYIRTISKIFDRSIKVTIKGCFESLSVASGCEEDGEAEGSSQ